MDPTLSAASHFAMMIQATEIRRELVIMVGWVNFVVADFSDHPPATSGRSIVRTTLRNGNSGSGTIA